MGDLFTICTGHWLLNSPHRSIPGHSEEERSRAITSSNSNLRLARHANRRQVHTQIGGFRHGQYVCSVLWGVLSSCGHKYVWSVQCSAWRVTFLQPLLPTELFLKQKWSEQTLNKWHIAPHRQQYCVLLEMEPIYNPLLFKKKRLINPYSDSGSIASGSFRTTPLIRCDDGKLFQTSGFFKIKV